MADIIWGDEQYENFKEDIIPAFCALAWDDIECQLLVACPLSIGSSYSCAAAFWFRTDQCRSVTEVSARWSIPFVYGTNSTALLTA